MLAIAAAERWRARVAGAGRRIAVRWRCGEELADVDPVRVAQALDNLIANALEHGGGQITIEGARRAGTDRAGGARPRPAAGDASAATTASRAAGTGCGSTRSLARGNGGRLRVRAGAPRHRRGARAAARPGRERPRPGGSTSRGEPARAGRARSPSGALVCAGLSAALAGSAARRGRRSR